MRTRHPSLRLAVAITTVAAAGLSLTAPARGAWINELHYDNTGADVGESVEVVFAPGEVPAGFRLHLYNGADGATYNTVGFSEATHSDEYRVRALPYPGLQNGGSTSSPAADGLALVRTADNAVVVSGGVAQFLSYEGTFTASNGPAAGLASRDIGVRESDVTAAGASLGLTGSGDAYDDFNWTGFPVDSFASANAGQTLGPGGPSAVPLPLAAIGSLALGLTVGLRRLRPVG